MENQSRRVDIQSILYMQEGKEGFLDKKYAGVLKGRTKFWCYIQGPLFYYQKHQNDIVNTFDLCQAESVKQSTTDTTCTQFEITFPRKKSHVFVCDTAQTCVDWVRSLQAAMALKDTVSNSKFFLGSSNDYETIPMDDSRSSSRSSKPVPVDTSETQQRIQFSTNSDPDYAVIDYSNKQPKNRVIVQKAEGGYYTPENGVKRDLNSNEPYVQMLKNTSDKPVITEVNKTENCPEYEEIRNVPDLMPNVHEVVRRQSKPKIVTNTKKYDNEDDDNDDGDGTDYFKELESFLDDRISLLPSELIPLKDEDFQPLEDMKEYLNNSRDITRNSRTRILSDVDPVSDLKQYLNELNI